MTKSVRLRTRRLGDSTTSEPTTRREKKQIQAEKYNKERNKKKLMQ